MQSILLDNGTWDFVLDANRNLAICSEPYSVLQDVATAVRVWLGEILYDATFGIAFDTSIFSGEANTSDFADQIEHVASQVEGVASALCTLGRLGQTRKLTGIIKVTLTDGTTSYVSL